MAAGGPRLKVSIAAGDPLLGRLLAEFLLSSGFDAVIDAGIDGPDDVAMVVLPSNVAEFHDGNWSRKLQDWAPENPLVVISSPGIPVRAVLSARSSNRGLGLVDRSTLIEVDSLVSITRLVYDGLQIIDPQFDESVGSNATVHFSDAERAVLDLLVIGYSNRAIASELYLSKRTVETHVRQIFIRLGLADDPSLNRRVLATRLITDGHAPLVEQPSNRSENGSSESSRER